MDEIEIERRKNEDYCEKCDSDPCLCEKRETILKMLSEADAYTFLVLKEPRQAYSQSQVKIFIFDDVFNGEICEGFYIDYEAVKGFLISVDESAAKLLRLVIKTKTESKFYTLSIDTYTKSKFIISI